MGQILENLHTKPPEEVFRRIASLSNIRRDKVLDIRRQLTEGTYEAADRLNTAMDRVLEAITDPKGKDTSVGVTAEGRKKCEELFRRYGEKK
jgi:flagellar motor switch protein FliG